MGGAVVLLPAGPAAEVGAGSARNPDTASHRARRNSRRSTRTSNAAIDRRLDVLQVLLRRRRGRHLRRHRHRLRVPGFPTGHVGNHHSAADTANYTALLAEFRSQLDALGGKRYALSAALPGGQDKIAKIQTDRLGDQGLPARQQRVRHRGRVPGGHPDARHPVLLPRLDRGARRLEPRAVPAGFGSVAGARAERQRPRRRDVQGCPASSTTPPTTTSIPPTTTTPPSIPAWAPNTAYASGAKVTYNGVTYTCRQAHTSLVGWEPPNVPARWLAS